MKALDMIASLRIGLENIRLDRYYSEQVIINYFSKSTKLFTIPKKNSRI